MDNLEVEFFDSGPIFLRWSIVCEYLISSKYRYEKYHDEIYLEYDREILRVLFEIPDMHDHDSDKCKQYQNHEKIGSEEDDIRIHEKKILLYHIHFP